MPLFDLWSFTATRRAAERPTEIDRLYDLCCVRANVLRATADKILSITTYFRRRSCRLIITLNQAMRPPHPLHLLGRHLFCSEKTSRQDAGV